MSEPDKTALLDNISTGILIVESDGTVSYLNSAAQIILEVSNSRTVGIELDRLFSGGEGDAIIDIKACLKTGSAFTKREAQLHLAGGHSLVVDCAVTPFQAQPGGSIAVIVELQVIDRWLRISREESIISSQQTTQTLIRGLAHEIKNPLGGLRGAAQLLDRELPDTELRDYTGIIIKEADRLRNLVDRMLGPRTLFSPQSLNIHEVLEYVHKLLTAEAPDTNRFQRDYDPSLPEVYGDREQLIQAILNVTRNALQAGADQLPVSTVTLRTRAVRQFSIGVHNYRLAVRVDIIDDGPGVPSELSDTLFFPMVSGSGHGTGLGLSIAQSILNQHSGLIEFESEPGNTVFSLYIPLGKQNE
ncbi:MAG: two-component system nitrogen regulation sensor histidine kinase GlnL [Halieaceae bacterium]|jgi:two-component system nitrogen regulation sensor histidine kinase GlnL